MASVMDAPDFDSLFASFEKKISLVCMKMAIAKLHSSQSPEEVKRIDEMIVNVGDMVEKLKEHFQQETVNHEEEVSALQSSLEHHKQKLEYILTQTKILEAKKASESNKRRTPSKNAQPSLRHLRSATKEKAKIETNGKPRQRAATKVIRIEYIEQDEYQTIPGYMLGRLTLNALNETIDSINTTLIEKYKFMEKNDHHAPTNEGEYKRFQKYKSQELPETKGIKFCTANDIKELGNIKNYTTLQKVLPCLRHCKRLKEIRGGTGANNKLVRYCAN